jgi:hypothetical protein
MRASASSCATSFLSPRNSTPVGQTQFVDHFLDLLISRAVTDEPQPALAIDWRAQSLFMEATKRGNGEKRQPPT